MKLENEVKMMVDKKYLVQVLTLTLIYFAVAKLGLILDSLNGRATLIWPPAGVGLAALLIFGLRLWPGIFLGALLANMSHHAHGIAALSVAVGNTASAFLVAFALVRFFRFRRAFGRVRDVIYFVGLSGLIGASIAATTGALSLYWRQIINLNDIFTTWTYWWVGDFLGAIIVAPLLLTWFSPKGRFQKTVSLGEQVVFSLFVVFIGVLVISRAESRGIQGHIFAYQLFPLIIWSALRFGMRITTTVNFVISILTIALATERVGPLLSGVLFKDTLFYWQIFIGALTLTGLLLAAAINEQWRVRKTLEASMCKVEKSRSDLRLAKSAAEVANLSKSAFLATMSHEIRTPLGAILGFNELLRNTDLSSTERDKYMEIVSRNGHRLVGLINEILELSKIESGNIEIDKTVLSVPDVVSDVVSSFQKMALEKDLKLSLEVQANAHALIVSDVGRIRQILSSLLGNAMKFTHQGEVRVAVGLYQYGESAQMLSIAVEDTGPGISLDMQEQLFVPFHQLDNSNTRKFGGAGLGLVLAKKLAQSLGGDVVLAASQVGYGSRFVFTLKSTYPEGERRGLKVPAPDNDTASFAKDLNHMLRNVRVLLVEDSPDNQLLISAFLRGAGATVDIASNGVEALKMAKESPYDVVLMDIHMPVMDGYRAVAELRSRGWWKPVVAITALAKKEDRERCMRSGFTDYISKPVDRGVLIQKVADYANFSRDPLGKRQGSPSWMKEA